MADNSELDLIEELDNLVNEISDPLLPIWMGDFDNEIGLLSFELVDNCME